MLDTALTFHGKVGKLFRLYTVYGKVVGSSEWLEIDNSKERGHSC